MADSNGSAVAGPSNGYNTRIGAYLPEMFGRPCDRSSSDDPPASPPADFPNRQPIFDEDEDFDNTSKVYLSVIWAGGNLGAAYYDLATSCLHVMADTAENDSFSLLTSLIRQTNPACVLTSTTQDHKLIEAIKATQNAGGGSLEDDDTSSVQNENFPLLLPTLAFSLEGAKRRILSLSLPGMPEDFDETQKILYLSSMISFDSPNMIRSVGALLKHVDKNRFELEAAAVPVMQLQTFSLKDMVIVDRNSMSALQIFQKDVHPSVYKAGHSSKEGLSLFGIMNRCKSLLGSKLLRVWFMRPTQDMVTLIERQDAVEYFSAPENQEISTTLSDCLKHIKMVPRILTKMRNAQLSATDWQSLYKTTYYASYIGDICKARRDVNVKILRKIEEKFTADLYLISDVISRIVDFDASCAQNRFVVRPGVDTELDESKAALQNLPEVLTKIAQEELDGGRLPPGVHDCTILYMPQIGYLMTLPACEQFVGVHMDGLEFMFQTAEHLHYKSAKTKELDETLGDTQCDIFDCEAAIMHQLQETILERSAALLAVMDLAAELDCLIAMAATAKEFNFVRPKILEKNEIKVEKCRHILQELCCSNFVPNDVVSGSGADESRIKLITGPNASGKSVYLKQVALLVFLAHIGSFVPAECAQVCLVDRIFTRIQSWDSVTASLSTFMLDVNQVNDALLNATSRSLIILDEFGKGTTPEDGVALLVATIDHWISQGSHCPHVFVATHLHAAVSLLPPSHHLSLQTMRTEQQGEELFFLYKLDEGHTKTSFAHHIANKAGLAPDIVRRAIQVTDLIRQNKCIERIYTEDGKHQMKFCAEIVSRFLKEDLDNFDVKDYMKKLADASQTFL